MKNSSKNLQYRLIPLEKGGFIDLVTLWVVVDAGKSLGFVGSTYRNETTPEGRHSTPLKWGYVLYKDGMLSGSECIFDSREKAGESLKALIHSFSENHSDDN